MTDDLTIAQGLRQAKALKSKLAELKDRLKKATVFVKGDEPAFPFDSTMSEYTATSTALCKLEARIAVANATATVKIENHEAPLAQAVRQLAELKALVALTRELPTQAKAERVETKLESYYDENMDRKHRSVTTTTLCVFTEAQKAARIAELQARFDRLNDAVEGMNHRTKLPHPLAG